MTRFRHVTVAVTLCGIGLFESLGHASDFGLIHFYGSVLYSGCYVLGTQSIAPIITVHNQDGDSLNFDMRFKHCRLVDRGQVLAEVSVLHHDWNTLRVLHNDGHVFSIKPVQTGEAVSRFSLKGFLSEINQIGNAALQFRQDDSHHYLSHHDVGLEIIYR